MSRLSLLAPLAAVLALAACGSQAAKPYLPDPTASCLRQHSFTVSTGAGVPLLEAAAANGGLRASPPGGGNTLVIGFAADGRSAAQLEREVRRVAPARLKPHLRDVMSSNRNAVLVWTISPTLDQQQTVTGCLSS